MDKVFLEHDKNRTQITPEEERNRTLVFSQNYGEASSIEFFKNKYPLPDAVSGHISYWIWRHNKIEDPVVILIGGSKADHLKYLKMSKKQ